MLSEGILKMFKRCFLRYISLFTIFVFISCEIPTRRSSAVVGDVDHSGSQGGVGTNDKLVPPQIFVLNNKTSQDKYLTLQWASVPNADTYVIYRAVYPTHAHASGSLESKAYKKHIEIPADPLTSTMFYNDPIPNLPLRRYSYVITAVNNNGESDFSSFVDGYRVPVDEEEALLDIDYTMHFVQSSIPNFGKQGLEVTVTDRANAGTYHYVSKATKIKSEFSNYGDFETILTNGQGFSMKINWSPLGTKMNGPIHAKGLYDATVTYENLVGVEGGYTRSGNIIITYQHPEKGVLTRKYSYDQARSLLKTVAHDASEVYPHPPKSEWDESDPGYTRAARKAARSARANSF